MSGRLAARFQPTTRATNRCSLSLATPIMRYLLHRGRGEVGRRGMLFSTQIAAVLTAFVIVQTVILAFIVVRLLVD